MSLFTAFFYPTLLGFLTLSIILRQVPLPNRTLFFWGTSFPAGAGLCSLILFASYLILPSQAKFVSLALSLIAAVCLLGYWLRHPQKDIAQPHTRIWQFDLKDKGMLLRILPSFLSFLLFAMTLVTVLQFYSLSVPMDIFGGGDTRYFWTLKAKFFFRSPEEWQGMFSPKLFWAHTDYPLLFPGILAWGWSWLGHESLLWSPLVSLGFYVSCTMLLVWYLSAYVSWTTGWIGGTFFLVLMPYLRWSIYQYADVPLTFFITACGLTLMAALRSDQKKIFIISGLLGGFAAWTKNEGLLFIVWVYVVLGAACGLRYHGGSGKPFAPLLGFSLGVLLPFFAFSFIKFFLVPHGNYLGPGPAFQNHQGFFLSGLEKTFTILKAFYVLMVPFKEWKGLWGFFIAAVIVLGIRKEKAPNDFAWVLFWVIVLINFGYILIFHITPHNLAWHITTSLNRLLLHSGGLALAFSFERLTFARKKI